MRSDSASATALATCALVAACSVTSPRPLPPRRVAFGASSYAPITPTGDLPRPAVPPLVHERYLGWTLAADMLSITPLTAWMAHPEDLYLPLPSLLLPPLIHAVHGETGTAAVSLLMRSAMLGGVYLAGRSIDAECRDEFICLPFGSLLLAEAAIVPVILIDSLLLARRVREDSAWHRLPLVPAVSAGPGGRVSLTVGSQF